MGSPGKLAALELALPHDLITEISRLRWLFVIARGSSFRLAGSPVAEAARLLGVRYVLRGTIEVAHPGVIIGVELVDSVDDSIVWAERFSGPVDTVHELRARIAEMPLSYEGASQGGITVSIGIGLSADASQSGDVLVREADAAMYEAKTRGRDQVVMRKVASKS